MSKAIPSLVISHTTLGLLLSTCFFLVDSGDALAMSIEARPANSPIAVDGNPDDWQGIREYKVALTGNGGVDEVNLRAAIRNDTLYVLARWQDKTKSVLHKPYQWRDDTQEYRRTGQLEDRLALSFAISGNFTHNKLDGSTFTADVWHWKANRSNPLGIAHDKMWEVTPNKPEEKAKKYQTETGQVYIRRPSDSGARLYKPLRYSEKQNEIMPRYELATNPTGSVTDIVAKGVWHDGEWCLELSRKLNTGNSDDAQIPANGTIEFAIAAFNDVDGKDHSTSKVLTLDTTR